MPSIILVFSSLNDKSTIISPFLSIDSPKILFLNFPFAESLIPFSKASNASPAVSFSPFIIESISSSTTAAPPSIKISVASLLPAFPFNTSLTNFDVEFLAPFPAPLRKSSATSKPLSSLLSASSAPDLIESFKTFFQGA